MKFMEKFYKTVGHHALKKYVVGEDTTNAIIKSSKKHIVFIPQEGEKMYAKIPKKISDALTPYSKEANSNVPTPQDPLLQDDGSLIVAFSYTHGVFGDCANETRFLAKIKENDISFALLGEQNYTNEGTKILSVKNDTVCFDSSAQDQYQQETEILTETLEEKTTQKNTFQENQIDSILQYVNEKQRQAQVDSFKNNMKKFEKHIYTQKVTFIK